MHREHERRQPASRHPHHCQQPPEQKAADRVKCYGDGVIAGGPATEERPLEPQGRVAQRKVVDPIGVEPDLGKGRRRRGLNRRVRREQRVVVPEPLGGEDGMTDRGVDPKHGEHDHRAAEQHVPRRTTGPVGDHRARGGMGARCRRCSRTGFGRSAAVERRHRRVSRRRRGGRPPAAPNGNRKRTCLTGPANGTDRPPCRLSSFRKRAGRCRRGLRFDFRWRPRRIPRPGGPAAGHGPDRGTRCG